VVDVVVAHEPQPRIGGRHLVEVAGELGDAAVVADQPLMAVSVDHQQQAGTD